uniref:Uncharacterized protein n=1 Tax=Cacopsylla melanoneura TaxID=428564 RepID=A0A8D8Z9J8_9HEMI
MCILISACGWEALHCVNRYPVPVYRYCSDSFCFRVMTDRICSDLDLLTLQQLQQFQHEHFDLFHHCLNFFSFPFLLFILLMVVNLYRVSFKRIIFSFISPCCLVSLY